ncbi:hypothetical protein ACFWZ2_22705 [Streptomyces sp. NPDC059002]|uniref:hypothetical protein n=1 Tax=Streptomyces sp. NPDC059002 TaxID=3346690 RepID=UPI0036C12203
MPNSAKRGTLRTVSCAAGALLVSLTIGACSGSDDTSDQSKPTPSATPTKDAARPEHIPGESVSKAPKLPEGKPLAEVAAAKGNQNIPLSDIAKGPLSVLVNCQGNGTLKVTVQPMGMYFPLNCVDGEVSSTYNELGLKKARPKGTVTVTAPSSVRWSLTVGQ